jgi:hypothetical protein
MHARRRKVTPGEPACNLEDTTAAAEPGQNRWAGDPEEPEPYTQQQSSKKEPGAKDRHPMPWGLVITDVFHMDVPGTYRRLVDELRLGDQATEYGTVLAALDSSARNLFEAARLARKSKLEDDAFATSLDKELEVLRSAAQRALEQEKAEGQRSKAPTIQDIKDRMLASWPDQVTSIEQRKAEMHGALRAIEGLEQSWRERCQALRVMAQQFKTSGA